MFYANSTMTIFSKLTEPLQKQPIRKLECNEIIGWV